MSSPCGLCEAARILAWSQGQHMATYLDPTTTATTAAKPAQPAERSWLPLAVSAIILVGGLTTPALLVAQSLQLRSALAERDKLVGQLEELKPSVDAISAEQARASIAERLITEQVLWQRVFATTAAGLFKDQQITAVQFDNKGAGSISGRAADRFAYAKSLAALYTATISVDGQSVPVFELVRPSTLSEDRNEKGVLVGVSYTFTVRLNPKAKATYQQIVGATQ